MRLRRPSVRRFIRLKSHKKERLQRAKTLTTYRISLLFICSMWFQMLLFVPNRWRKKINWPFHSIQHLRTSFRLKSPHVLRLQIWYFDLVAIIIIILLFDDLVECENQTFCWCFGTFGLFIDLLFIFSTQLSIMRPEALTNTKVK